MMRKKLVIVLLILGIVSLASAQSKEETYDDLLKRADEYRKSQNHQEAILTYKKAIELFPNNDLAYVKLERLYLALDKFDEANSIYSEYVNKMGDGELLRILMLNQFGKSDLAITELLKMINLVPNYAPASSTLGSIYSRQGKYLRAKIYLENALNIYRQQGDTERAKKIEEDLQSIYSKKPEAVQLKLETFSSPQNNITVEYPSDWYVKEEKGKDIYAVFLSREKVSKSGDIFKTGISVLKFYNADQFEFDMPPNKIRLFPDMKSTSMALYVDVLCTQLIIEKKLISRVTYRAKINDLPVYMAEISFKNDFGFSETMILVVAYKDNTFVKFILEAPIEEFEKLYPTFMKVMENSKLF